MNARKTKRPASTIAVSAATTSGQASFTPDLRSRRLPQIGFAGTAGSRSRHAGAGQRGDDWLDFHWPAGVFELLTRTKDRPREKRRGVVFSRVQRLPRAPRVLRDPVRPPRVLHSLRPSRNVRIERAGSHTSPQLERQCPPRWRLSPRNVWTYRGPPRRFQRKEEMNGNTRSLIRSYGQSRENRNAPRHSHHYW
jgi:hypothetical protein